MHEQSACFGERVRTWNVPGTVEPVLCDHLHKVTTFVCPKDGPIRPDCINKINLMVQKFLNTDGGVAENHLNKNYKNL